MDWFLLMAVLGAALVGYLGFSIGDKKRGTRGPRPLRSIGEALSLAELRQGKTLVIFLGEDEASRGVGEALVSNPLVLSVLSQPKPVSYTHLRAHET